MYSLRSILVIGVCRLLVMLAVPKQVFSFSSHPHVVSHPPPLDSRSIKSASFSTYTTTSAEVLNNVANIHSLNSITSNPRIFPITSDYIHTLSRLQHGDSGIRGPSAEEFLNNLSRELFLLSQIEDAQTLEHTTSSSRSEPFAAASRDSYQTSYHAMEVAGPGFTSAFGVGVAAQTYDPAIYSQYMSPTIVASADGGGVSYWNGDSDLYGQPAITATNSAAMDNHDVVDTFASWQKTRGGSNVLRDLALSVPIDDEMHQQSQQQLDFSHVEAMREIDYIISEQGNDASTMTSYNHLGGRDGPPLYIAENEQLGVTFTNDLDEGNYAWSSIGDGQQYYYHDISSVSSDSASTLATTDGTVRSFDAISNQASHLSQVDSDLSSSLSAELSDVKYEDFSNSSPNLHHTRELMSGDMITSKLEQLGLPRYHLELPVITNPFSEISPSLQNALISIKQASEASKGKVDGYLETITHSLDGLAGNAVDASESVGSLSGHMINKVADIGASGLNAIGNALQSGASNIAKIHPPSYEHLPMPNMNVHTATSAVMNRIGEASLSDFGNVVLSTLKFTCGIVINLFGLIINAMSGTKIASVLTDAQSAVFSLIDNASHIVVSTIRDIGNMSVIEIIQHLMALVIAVTDILIKILNAIIYLASGNDGASWAIIATSSIKDSSSQLLAHAASTYNHVTHASLSELAHSVGDYGQIVGNEFVTLMGSLGNANGMPISEDLFGNVASILQTGMSL